MKTGNVVRLSKGHLVIITNVNKDTTQWVSFSSSNMSGVTRNKSYNRTEKCYECSDVEVDYHGTILKYTDKECELCKGEASYKETIDGMDKAKVMANCVKDFIISRTMKNFEF
jgi:hypothetical protein|tara:strand:- start:741 stop:1079 length:339 start_codon:yes stop_codon:yes gene_type:complete